MSTEDANADEKIIIKGINHQGKIFRPSDWVERLAAILSSFEDGNRLKYHNSAYPCNIEGIKSLIISKKMSDESPSAYTFIMDFAHNNNLTVLDDRRRIKCVTELEEDRRQPEESSGQAA